jgi:hypothetical protein
MPKTLTTNLTTKANRTQEIPSICHNADFGVDEAYR